MNISNELDADVGHLMQLSVYQEVNSMTPERRLEKCTDLMKRADYVSYTPTKQKLEVLQVDLDDITVKLRSECGHTFWKSMKDISNADGVKYFAITEIT